MRLVTTSPRATQAAAARLARRLKGGEVVCLFGPLGSGKTTFIQGLVRALGSRTPATSPSFMLVREYRSGPRARKAGPRTVYHMDFYRVAPNEIANLGLEDYLSDPDGVCLIEWAEAALESLPADRLEVRFAYPRGGGAPGSERVLAFKAGGPASRRLLA